MDPITGTAAVCAGASPAAGGTGSARAICPGLANSGERSFSKEGMKVTGFGIRAVEGAARRAAWAN